MTDVRGAPTYDELDPLMATFTHDGTITSSSNHYDGTFGSPEFGEAVAMVTDSQVGLGADGGYLLGKLVKVDWGGDVCTVQIHGTCYLPYLAGNVPIIGRGVVVHGDGTVYSPAGGVRLATERGIVLSLDTTNHFVYVYLP